MTEDEKIRLEALKLAVIVGKEPIQSITIRAAAYEEFIRPSKPPRKR